MAAYLGNAWLKAGEHTGQCADTDGRSAGVPLSSLAVEIFAAAGMGRPASPTGRSYPGTFSSTRIAFVAPQKEGNQLNSRSTW